MKTGHLRCDLPRSFGRLYVFMSRSEQVWKGQEVYFYARLLNDLCPSVMEVVIRTYLL
jgi:hypothetical protein